MKKEEIKNMLNYIKNSYPIYYKNINIDDALVNLWYSNFGIYNKYYVALASKEYITNNSQPPAISDLLLLVNAKIEPYVEKYAMFLDIKKNVFVPEKCKDCEIGIDDGFEQRMCSWGSYCYKSTLRQKLELQNSISQEEVENIEKLLGKEYIEYLKNNR